MRGRWWLSFALLGACEGEFFDFDAPIVVPTGPWQPPPNLPYAWVLPPGYPKPYVPLDTTLSQPRVELGRHLFYDTRLSFNQTQSCASCHEQAKAFTDGKKVGLGSTGESHVRNPMSLTNAGYNSVYTWANPLVTSLEKHALLPLFGESPVELGMAGQEETLFARLKAEPRYQQLFPLAYPGEAEPYNLKNLLQALGAFQRTLVSYRSPYDRFVYGKQDDALSSAARRGFELFFDENHECFHCHGGFNFSGTTITETSSFVEVAFHNTGLYNVDGAGAYPVEDQGLAAITANPEDMGHFRAPTLRNIAVTGPYMHDGSISTLSEVLDHYARGGRALTTGPDAGDGATNPFKSGFVRGFAMDEADSQALLAFLEALTDEGFMQDPRYADPWLSSEK